MNVDKAMDQTVRLAFDRGMKTQADNGLGYDHIAGMLLRIDQAEGTLEPFSYGKKCRWLGWAQAAVVASGAATLEDMKAINTLNREDKK